mgnify:CR=1 FL=1
MEKNLVLDLDHTLIHTQDDNRDFKKLKLYSDSKNAHLRKKTYNLNLVDVEPSPPGSGDVMQLTGAVRPYLKEFRDFIFKNFNRIIVWSAGRGKYVRRLCEILFPGENFPYDVLTYDDCDIDEGNQVFKPLQKIFDKYPEMNEKNTLLIDDRLETIEDNKDNGIMIPPFHTKLKKEDLEDNNDVCLLKLMSWFSLKEFKNCSDVRELYKDDIFRRTISEYSNLVKREKEENEN